VSTKTIGFNLEVTSNDASMVITGIRILLGSQDTSRVPGFIQVISIYIYNIKSLLLNKQSCIWTGFWTSYQC